MSNQEIAIRLGIAKGKVTPWTERWINRALEPIRDHLSDLPHPRASDAIAAEQGCRVLALACESPQDYGQSTLV